MYTHAQDQAVKAATFWGKIIRVRIDIFLDYQE